MACYRHFGPPIPLPYVPTRSGRTPPARTPPARLILPLSRDCVDRHFTARCHRRNTRYIDDAVTTTPFLRQSLQQTLRLRKLLSTSNKGAKLALQLGRTPNHLARYLRLERARCCIRHHMKEVQGSGQDGERKPMYAHASEMEERSKTLQAPPRTIRQVRERKSASRRRWQRADR